MIIDSHFHTLSMKRKGIDSLPSDLIGIDVGTDSGDAAERLKLLPFSTKVFGSIGSGPWVLDSKTYEGPDREREKLLKDYQTYGADAIGECGFDNHWKYGSPGEQLKLFMMQVELASELDLPIIIHTRDADKEILDALCSSEFRCRGVMHCYSSDTYLMKAALDKGLFISFAGNVTYKSNEMIREAAKAVPIDRILYETDSPYLAPIPMRGKPSNPAFTEYTLEFLADLRNEDKDNLKMHVRDNLFRMLGRDNSVFGPRIS